jgi:menaquinone-dependent protoporphyrinogen IX oxidase
MMRRWPVSRRGSSAWDPSESRWRTQRSSLLNCERIGQRNHLVFAGALNYSKLDHADRMAMKAAGAREGDFRDWSAIDNWTDAIVADLA